MDSIRFDDVTRAISPLLTRRGLAGVLGLAALGTAGVADAKRKKRKKRKKKNKNNNNNGGGGGNEVKLNAFGCVNVGNFCENAGQCCSGICQNAACQAHDQINCQAGQTDFTCSGNINFLDCGNNGLCLTTTGNAGFCAEDRKIGPDCVTCTKDADCVSACGQDAACVICANCPGGVTCAGSGPFSC